METIKVDPIEEKNLKRADELYSVLCSLEEEYQRTQDINTRLLMIDIAKEINNILLTLKK